MADLKVRFPSLQEGMKGFLSSEMEKVVREEKFLKEEPERLESALKRCKKLTGTLVTLKRYDFFTPSECHRDITYWNLMEFVELKITLMIEIGRTHFNEIFSTSIN